MGIQEFSDGFSELLNNHEYLAQFGEPYAKNEIVLDEYEKSLFLTKAQDEIALNLYNGKNAYGDSFENTEELRRYLAPLVVDASLESIKNSEGTPIGIRNDSSFFTLPTDLWFIIYEAVGIEGNSCKSNSMVVVPVTHDEYHRLKNNPFRGPNDRRALRLDLSDGVVEIVCNYSISNYYLRYLRKPKPIILVDLSNSGLTIEGKNQAMTCELHDALHKTILERAVTLAIQHKGYRGNDNK